MRFLIFLFLPIFVCAAENETLSTGYAFIHSSMNKVNITADGRSFIPSRENNLARAFCLNVKCDEDSTAAIVLSNNVSLIVDENSEIFIESVQQPFPINYQLNQEFDSSKSVTIIKIKKGSVHFSCPEFRPSSLFIVSTNTAEYSVRAKYTHFECDEKSDSLFVHDGIVTTESDNTKKTFATANRYTINSKADKLSVSSKPVSDLTLMKESSQFENIKILKNSVLYNCDNENNVSAERVVSSLFIKLPGKYNLY